MKYLIQSEMRGNNSKWYKFSEKTEDTLEAMDEGREVIPCVTDEEGVNVLRNRHDHLLPSGLSYVSHHSESNGWLGNMCKVHDIPFVERIDLSSLELINLIKSEGKVIVDSREVAFNHPECEQMGLYFTDAYEYPLQFVEYSPAKIKARKKQGKYYRRGRMRRGDLPLFIPRELLFEITHYLYEVGIETYYRGTGSTEGCISSFISAYDGMKELNAMPLARRKRRTTWFDRFEDASHYVVGCEEYHVNEEFAKRVREECEALGMVIPAYKKGQRYE